MGKATVSGVRVGAARAVPAMPGMVCCECKFEGASRWHWAMHDWVEQRRCVYRFACRNLECLALHTIAEQEHKRTKQKLGQREWEAECGFCSVGTCRYGAVCQRAVRVSVAYDSSYEDEEDGWSVVGGGRGCGAADPVDRTDVANLGTPGRFGLLGGTVDDDILGDEFFDCDDPEFQFKVREERRVRQQESRRQTGQQRKGRTARKRAAAAIAAEKFSLMNDVAMRSHSANKRIRWLSAKSKRAESLWRAVHVEARECYGSSECDRQEFSQWVRRMKRAQVDDWQFWNDAMVGVWSGGVGFVLGEKQRLQRTQRHVEMFRRMAVDGRKDRFKLEKMQWGATSQCGPRFK